MICRKCNQEFNDTARFCPYCGTPVAAPESQSNPGNETPAQATPSQAAGGNATPPQASSAQRAADQAASGQRAGGQAVSDQRAGGQAATSQRAGGQAASGQRAGGQAAPSQRAVGPAASRQAASGQSASTGQGRVVEIVGYGPKKPQLNRRGEVMNRVAPTPPPKKAAKPGFGSSSGGGGVKGVYVVVGAVLMFLVGFLLAALFVRVIPGMGASRGNAGAGTGTAVSGAAETESSGDVSADAAVSGEAGASGEDASYADDAAAGTAGESAAGTGTAVSGEEDASYADDATAGESVDGTGTAVSGEAEASYADEAAAEAAQMPAIPVLKVERFYYQGANGYCEENYTRVLLGDGTEDIFPELHQALIGFSDQRVAEIDTEYNDLVSYAEETQRTLSVNMSMELARADEHLLSLVYGFSDYSGGAHGFFYNSGAAFDVETGQQLTLADICTDREKLADIVAAQLYAEEPERFYDDEATLRQTIWSSYFEKAEDAFWAVMPEGVMFYFPPYGIGPYAAGQPYTLVRFDEYPGLFNDYYCTTQTEYVTYQPGWGMSATKQDLDGNGTQETVYCYGYSAQDQSAGFCYQDLHIYVNDQEVLVQSTPVYRNKTSYFARVGGKTLYMIQTDNLDDTVSTYVFDMSSTAAVLTEIEDGGIFEGSVMASGYSVGLQSSLPGRILFRGVSAEAHAVTADGMIE